MDRVIMQITNIVAVLMKTFGLDIISNGITMDCAIMQIVLIKSLCFDIISIRCHFMNLLIMYVQSFQTIGQLRNKLWENNISRELR